MNQIPSFFSPSKLTIQSAREFEKNGQIKEMVVKDPEGDQLTITHWTEDTGFAAVMPNRKLNFEFKNQETGTFEKSDPTKNEYVQLSYGLSDAQDAQELHDDGFGMPTAAGGESDPIDSYVVDWIISEISERGGVVRAF